MASSENEQAGSSDLTLEIAHLREKYGHQCRVITRVGDFQYILSVKRNSSDLIYKFQIDDDYPRSKPNIIINSSQLLQDDKDRLVCYLKTTYENHSTRQIIDHLIMEADLWLKSHSQDLQYVFQEKSKEGKIRKKSNKKSIKSRNVEESTNDEKMSSMKTAAEVIKRIQWDSQLPTEFFSIGYLDRFIGIVETNFSAFSWEDLASADVDDLAIPQHRIQYFKYKNEKVWDKKKRMDKVFGSTGDGKTILDVMKEYKETEAGENLESPSDAEEDSDEEVVVKTGFTNDMFQFLGENRNMKQESNDTQTENNAKDENPDKEPSSFDEESATNHTPSKREQYWGQKRRPTHFLCLRIEDPTIVENVTDVYNQILKMEPSFFQSMIPPERLHITLACVGLDTDEDLNNACKFLYSIQDKLQNLNPQGIEIQLEDTDNFFHNVLYAKVKENHAFINFVEHLRSLILGAGIEIRDVFDFTPHMTLLKFKKQTQKELKTRFTLDSRIYEAVRGQQFGKQNVSSIYLCEMSNVQENGFYITPAQIHFKETKTKETEQW